MKKHYKITKEKFGIFKYTSLRYNTFFERWDVLGVAITHLGAKFLIWLDKRKRKISAQTTIWEE